MTTMTPYEAMTPNGERLFFTNEPVVALKRRTIDTVLISFGAVFMAALLAAASLLTWGSNFAKDYVDDELSSQHITFGTAESLEEGDRADLVKYADQVVNTGPEAEAYASYINGHLTATGPVSISDGQTYAELGAVERAAKNAVTEAKDSGASDDEIAALQATADEVTATRNTVFKGETLRGLLLTAFAWSTVGRIAGYAAMAAFAAGAVMLVLVLFGLRHHHKVVQQS